MPNKIVDTYRHVFGLKGFDYDQVDDGVFVGTNMCCQFGFDKELLAKGIRADISLEKIKIDAPTGIDYFLWLPTEDHQAPTPDALRLGVNTLAFFADRKIGVYIHCKNGHGRAPTLFAAYLISKGMEVDEALLSIKKRRPAIHINEAQVAALRTFGDTLRGGR